MINSVRVEVTEAFSLYSDIARCLSLLLLDYQSAKHCINDHGSTVQHAFRLIAHLSSLQPAVLGGVINLSIFTKAVVEPSKCSDKNY